MSALLVWRLRPAVAAVPCLRFLLRVWCFVAMWLWFRVAFISFLSALGLLLCGGFAVFNFLVHHTATALLNKLRLSGASEVAENANWRRPPYRIPKELRAYHAGI